MEEIADIISTVLSSAHPVVLTKGERAGEKSKIKAKADKSVMEEAKNRVHKLLSPFPLYPALDLEWLEKEFVK